MRRTSVGMQVRRWIAKMKAESKAFYCDSCYLLAGVLFQRQQSDVWASAKGTNDLTDQLLNLLTAFK